MNKSSNPVGTGEAVGVVPTQERGREAREQLYVAAMREFEASGVEDSRVESIVKEAGASWGTFFRYFPRKEDVLIHAAARHFRDHVLPVFEAGVDDPEKSAWQLGQDVFLRLTEPEYSPRLHAAMIAETIQRPLRFAAILDLGDFPVIRLFEGLIRKGMGTGEVRTDVDSFEAATVIGAGVMFSTTRVLGAVADGDLPVSEVGAVAGRAFEIAWNGVGSGASVPAPR